MKIVHVVDNKDNVATIISDNVKKATDISVEFDGDEHQIKINADIPYGHKIAIRPIVKGDTVWKYGQSIGKATENIEVGDHVHIHNIEPLRGRGDLSKIKKEGEKNE